jgi:arylsulfatase A-like enzyme
MSSAMVSLTAFAERPQPNVIVILTDDLGWGDLGCYPKGGAWGDEAVVATPNLDRLAASGARFTDAYATGMVCSPSRAGLMSGRYQQTFGWYGFVENNAGIPANIKLLPQALREAGYATGMIGKWHTGYYRGFTPLDRGFDRFFGFLGGQHDYFDANLGSAAETVANAPDGWILDQDKPVENVVYLTDEFTDRALEFMRGAHAAQRPFFLYLSYNTPHPPLQSTWEELEPLAKQRTNGRFTSRDIARAMIMRLDSNIARLTAWLEESGIASDTLIVFSSDNGGHDDGPGNVVQHNGGLRARKGYFYEGGIRVPFLVSWPGRVPAGLVYRQPVSHLDIYPTVLAAAGVSSGKWPEKLDGVNLLPFLSGEQAGAPHERLFWSLETRGIKWAVRQGRWKLVNDDTVPSIDQRLGKPKFQTQLFDLESDPFEEHDLAVENPELVSSLKKEMAEFHASMKPTIYTTAVKASYEAMMVERKKNPALDSLPRTDGAPGHWIGAGAKDRLEKEKTEKGGLQ